MRVLHVIDAGRPLLREFARPRLEQTFDDRVLACRDLIAHARGGGWGRDFDHRTCILGTSNAAARAASLGLSIDTIISPLRGIAHLAVGSVGPLIKSVRPDLVHWWDRRWTAGCFGAPGRAWRLESVLGSTPLQLPLWLSRGNAIVCGPAERAAAMQANLEAFDIPAPAFTPSIRRVPEGDAANVLLLGPGANARDFLFMCGLIWGWGMKLTAIVPSSAVGLDRTRRVGRTFQYPVKVLTSNAPRSELLSQCAAAVWMGPARSDTASPAVAIQSALAAGIPVAVPFEAEWTVPAQLRHRLVGKNCTPNELARVLINIVSNPPALSLPSDPSNSAFARAVLNAYQGRSSTTAPAETPLAQPHWPAA